MPRTPTPEPPLKPSAPISRTEALKKLLVSDYANLLTAEGLLVTANHTVASGFVAEIIERVRVQTTWHNTLNILRQYANHHQQMFRRQLQHLAAFDLQIRAVELRATRVAERANARREREAHRFLTYPQREVALYDRMSYCAGIVYNYVRSNEYDIVIEIDDGLYSTMHFATAARAQNWREAYERVAYNVLSRLGQDATTRVGLMYNQNVAVVRSGMAAPIQTRRLAVAPNGHWLWADAPASPEAVAGDPQLPPPPYPNMPADRQDDIGRYFDWDIRAHVWIERRTGQIYASDPYIPPREENEADYRRLPR